ncbi:hypothetical protein [Streptomyces fungicidicus]|uniref:hypothetical protein n=1 Tax=Streptomyces fungicidicus TaxID=68203 RepID=UPI003829C275
MFRSSNPKKMAAEVEAAYDNRIDAMCIFGSSSPEALVAEVQADDLYAAFREQTGGQKPEDYR